MKKIYLAALCLAVTLSCKDIGLSKTNDQLKTVLMPTDFFKSITMASTAIMEGLMSKGSLSNSKEYSLRQYGKITGQSLQIEDYIRSMDLNDVQKKLSASPINLTFSGAAKKYLDKLSEVIYKVNNYKIGNSNFDFTGFSNLTKKSIDSLENEIIFETQVSRMEKATLLMSTTITRTFLSQLQVYANLISDTSANINGRLNCFICDVFSAVVNVVVAIVQTISAVIVGALTGAVNALAGGNGLLAAPFCGIAGAISGFYFGIKGTVGCWGQAPYSSCFINNGIIPSTKICVV